MTAYFHSYPHQHWVLQCSPLLTLKFPVMLSSQKFKIWGLEQRKYITELGIFQRQPCSGVVCLSKSATRGKQTSDPEQVVECGDTSSWGSQSCISQVCVPNALLLFQCNSENIPLEDVSSFPLTFRIKSSARLHGQENSKNSHWQERKEKGSVGGEEMKEWVILNYANCVSSSKT